MKVIIPVAGAGTKLRPFTYTQPKALIPLAGKTILGFILDQLLDAGIKDFIFIIGHLGEKIQDFVIENYPEINANFIVQMERGGTGHAIFLAKNLLKENEEILIVYGDTICEYDVENVLKNKHSCFGIKKVDDPRNFGVVEMNQEGKVTHVIEKPIIPKSNMALVGIYKIKETKILFQSLKSAIENNAITDYPLTSAIESMIQKDVFFEPFVVGNWYDCGKKESLLDTNAILLNKIGFASNEVPFFDNTIIIHPVSIAKDCVIENSIIGPNVTIGENAKISSSIIKDSIIGTFTQLNQVVLHKSLIGSDAYIRGYTQSLNIGDNTEIDLQ